MSGRLGARNAGPFLFSASKVADRESILQARPICWRWHLFLITCGFSIAPPNLPEQAVVRGLRYPVTFVLELLASGMTEAEILADYEDLEAADLRACQAYAAEALQVVTRC